jgi:hypothetical protein
MSEDFKSDSFDSQARISLRNITKQQTATIAVCTASFTMASRARQITALVTKQGNTIARRTYHASPLTKAGMAPPLPPFARIPVESGSVRSLLSAGIWNLRHILLSRGYWRSMPPRE